MTDWTQPRDVDDVTLAFPASVIGKFLPEWDEIPETFQRETAASQPWYDFQGKWFHSGLGEETGFEGVHLKEGVDGDKAFRHLSACQKSFEPQHEHKMAGVAWLASLWFDSVIWRKVTKE